jgi:hypothetical protein
MVIHRILACLVTTTNMIYPFSFSSYRCSFSLLRSRRHLCLSALSPIVGYTSIVGMVWMQKSVDLRYQLSTRCRRLERSVAECARLLLVDRKVLRLTPSLRRACVYYWMQCKCITALQLLPLLIMVMRFTLSYPHSSLTFSNLSSRPLDRRSDRATRPECQDTTPHQPWAHPNRTLSHRLTSNYAHSSS